MNAARPTSPPPPSTAAAVVFDRTLAVLLLLPGLLLALPAPLAPLWFDPYPRLAGAGFAALASVPVALFLLWFPGRFTRGRDIRGAFLLTLLLLLGLAFVLLGGATDTFEARRALVLFAACAVLLVGAGHLEATGRRWLVRGTLVSSVAWTGFALFHYALAADGHLSGVLGNTGPLSQAALPGAAVGTWFILRRRRVWVVPGVLALGLYLVHASLAAVNAALVSILGVFFLGMWRGRRDGLEGVARRLPWVLVGITIVGAVGVRIATGLGSDREILPVAVPAVDDEPIAGGVEVRLRIWRRMPAVLAYAPVCGLGPGQFLAEFPPFRDPREAVISRHGPCAEMSTEVEHPHNDWMHGVVQFGVPGGLLWLAFLLLVLRACRRAVKRGSDVLAAAGMAGAAVLLNALFHAPLLVSPASAVVAFPLFGLLLEEDGRDAPRMNRMALCRTLGLLGLLAAWFAVPLVQHGRATSDYVQAARRLGQWAQRGELGAAGERERAASDAREAMARAERAAPDSVAVGILRAQHAEDEASRLEALDAVLAHRPHSFAALSQKGFALARADRLDEARPAWEAALALDPHHPKILGNLARLEMTTGHTEQGYEYLVRLRINGCLVPEWLETLGTELLLEGRIDAGRTAFAELDDRMVAANAGEIDALAQDAKRLGNQRRADALRSLAHLLYAREQVADNELPTAIRSYRQALLPTRDYIVGGAPLLRLELAAAELRDGRIEEARRTLEGNTPSPLDVEELPSWAAVTLAEAGLLDSVGE